MTGADSRSADVIVIGGGIHGCSTALHLARLGLRPVLLEKDHVGRHASGVNAGGVRRLGRHLAEVPLSVASMQIWHEIESLVDDDCGFTSHGQIKVAENEKELAILRQRVASMQALATWSGLCKSPAPAVRVRVRLPIPIVPSSCVPKFEVVCTAVCRPPLTSSPSATRA